jgi:hypothetical protein
MSQLRLYTFANFYLSAIQAGIQSAHVVHELFVKYKNKPTSDHSRTLYDWATNHKTMIVLNGGANDGINAVADLFINNAKRLKFPAPFASFNEDDISLGGIMTAVGIILPEEIYEAVSASRLQIELGFSDLFEGDRAESYYFVKDKIIEKHYPKDSAEWDIIKLLKSCPLAR